MASSSILVNTVASYVRSLLSVGLALFSSRWVLQYLGATDYGLYSLVGSLIVIVVFLNTIMVGSTGRHYAYAVGQGKSDEVRKWFNAALGLHLALAILIAVVGLPIGEYVIRFVLDIPEPRVEASIWVFRLALLSAFITIVSVAFLSMYSAKQRIAELAAWGLLQSILGFCLAYSLRYIRIDLLIFYAMGMVIILLIIRTLQVGRAIKIFPECRIKKVEFFNKARIKDILGFGCWNLIGGLGWTSRDQGTALILNLYFGTKLNAAYGIAIQVSNQTNALSTSMMGAFTPEITASEGRGDRKRVLMLAERGSKFAVILIMIFAIPLIVEMEYVLALWLKNPPKFAADLCRLVLIALAIDRTSAGGMMAVSAYGKIAKYQMSIGGIQLLTLPLVWILIVVGVSPKLALIAFVVTSTLMTFGRMFWVQKLLGVNIMNWVKNVFMPCVLTGLMAYILPLLTHKFMMASIERLLLVILLSEITVFTSAYLWILNKEERLMSGDKIKILIKKIKWNK